MLLFYFSSFLLQYFFFTPCNALLSFFFQNCRDRTLPIFFSFPTGLLCFLYPLPCRAYYKPFLLLFSPNTTSAPGGLSTPNNGPSLPIETSEPPSTTTQLATPNLASPRCLTGSLLQDSPQEISSTAKADTAQGHDSSLNGPTTTKPRYFMATSID